MDALLTSGVTGNIAQQNERFPRRSNLEVDVEAVSNLGSNRVVKSVVGRVLHSHPFRLPYSGSKASSAK